MKAIEQFFAVVLFIILYKVALTFKSVDEILKCDLSNESYRAVLFSCGVFFMLYKESYSLTIEMKAIEEYLPVGLT